VKTSVVDRIHSPVARLAVQPHGPVGQVTGRYSALARSNDRRLALTMWAVVGPLLVVVTMFLVNAAFALALAATILVAPLMFVAAQRRRDDRDLVAQLPELVDIVGRSLRSGATLRGALVEAADAAPAAIAVEIRLIVDALVRGVPSQVALHDWTARSPLPEIRMVAASLALASEHEAGSTQALDGVGQALRDGIALANEIRSLTAQASVSMQAMVLLPFGFIALDAAAGQTLVGYLVHERFGRLCLVTGCVLDLAGWFWMRCLVRRQLPR